MDWKFYNSGVVQLTAPMLSTDLTCTVDDASIFDLGPDFPLICATEIMYVTGIVGNVLTVSRAQEDTIAIAHDIGDNMYYALTAGVLADGIEGPPGPAGATGATGSPGYSGSSGLDISDIRAILCELLNIDDIDEQGEFKMLFHGARVFRSTNQSITNNTNTAITFDTVETDTDGYFNTGATGKLTIPAGKAGWYLLNAMVAWGANATGARYTSIRKNGATYLASDTKPVNSAGDAVTCSCQAMCRLEVGDYLELIVNQQTGGNFNAVASSDYAPIMSIALLGQ